MRFLEIRLRNALRIKEINTAISEVGVQLNRGSTLLTYREVCEICQFATSGEYTFSTYVENVLSDVVKMWEHWGDSEPISIEYGSTKFHYLRFID